MASIFVAEGCTRASTVFAGDWVSESVADDDIGPAKKGEKYNAYLSYKWSPNKEALLVTYSAEIGGKTFDTRKGIAGWDAVKKHVLLGDISRITGGGKTLTICAFHQWSVVGSKQK